MNVPALLALLIPVLVHAVDPLSPPRTGRVDFETRTDPRPRALRAPVPPAAPRPATDPFVLLSARVVDTNAGPHLQVLYRDEFGNQNVTYKSIAAIVRESLTEACAKNLSP